jgi:hypothetical protein
LACYYYLPFERLLSIIEILVSLIINYYLSFNLIGLFN